MNPGDPMPDTRPFTLAAAFLWSKGYASVDWAADQTGLEQVKSVEVEKLRHWREEFYAFAGRAYRKLVPEELAAEVTNFLNRQNYFGLRGAVRPIKVTRSLEGDVLSQLRRICQVVTESMPTWLGEAGERPDPKHIIAFQNGLLDVDAWLGDSGVELIPLTPEWFSEAVLPCEFNAAARCPRWAKFLADALDDDAELIVLLQEFFGYCLTGDTSLQKMLWLHGASGAGKGTVLRILRKVVGDRNTVSFDLWSLLGNFTLSAFLGKRLAISGDAHLGNGTEADKVLAKLKGISGEDEQLIDRKNREMLSSVHLTVRFVISTNEFPNLPDASDALARRAMFIPFDRSFQGEANPNLTAELEAELAGITVWALHGLRRLLTQRRFSEAAAARRVAEEFKRLQSPVYAFVEECCVRGLYVPPENGIRAKHAELTINLYAAFKRWAERSGRKPVSEEKFGERLRRVVPALQRVRLPEDIHGKRVWQYRGVELLQWAEVEFLNGGGPASAA